MSRFAGRRVLLGVSGSIAAYKACDLARELVKGGAEVHVLMTHAATRLVGPLTFRNLTGQLVGTDMFDQTSYFLHLEAARSSDLAIVAPATANCLAKLALGLADDLLSTAMLAVTSPVIVAPAMNTRMYDHPAVQKNLETLRDFGYRIVSPEVGALACGEEGIGRLAEVPAILAAAEAYLPGA